MSDDFLNLNFTDQEAASEVREFSALPSGSYLVAITDMERRESTSEKHNGKPYVTLELTVQDDGAGGNYVGSKAWWNVMLFDGALYSLGQILKAWDLVPGRDPVPPLDQWLGKEFVMVGAQEQAKTKDEGNFKNGKQVYVNKFEEKDGRRVPVMRYEVKGAKHPNTWKGAAGSGRTPTTQGAKSSLLPS
jgi:hypothetical protein